MNSNRCNHDPMCSLVDRTNGVAVRVCRVLEPIVYWIGNTPLLHGERAEEDPLNPEACLCGHPFYMACPEWYEHGIASWTLSAPGDER